LALGGDFVLRRILGAWDALRIRRSKRSRASRRLLSRVRKFLASMINTPSRVMRLPAKRRKRRNAPTLSVGELAASNLSCTAVETLLTFCPPGPEARMKLSLISLSSIEMRDVTRIMRKTT